MAVHFLDLAKFLIVNVCYVPIKLHRLYYILSITSDCVTRGKGVLRGIRYYRHSALRTGSQRTPPPYKLMFKHIGSEEVEAGRRASSAIRRTLRILVIVRYH